MTTTRKTTRKRITKQRFLRIRSEQCMSTAQWKKDEKPDWWARIGKGKIIKFITDIPKSPGNKPLDVTINCDAWKIRPGERVYYGVGHRKGATRGFVRATKAHTPKAVPPEPVKKRKKVEYPNPEVSPAPIMTEIQQTAPPIVINHQRLVWTGPEKRSGENAQYTAWKTDDGRYSVVLVEPAHDDMPRRFSTYEGRIPLQTGKWKPGWEYANDHSTLERALRAVEDIHKRRHGLLGVFTNADEIVLAAERQGLHILPTNGYTPSQKQNLAAINPSKRGNRAAHLEQMKREREMPRPSNRRPGGLTARVDEVVLNMAQPLTSKEICEMIGHTSHPSPVNARLRQLVKDGRISKGEDRKFRLA